MPGIKNVACPRCETTTMLDREVWQIGSVRIRCAECAHYFLPEGSPGDRTVEEVANASVPIAIWEPEDG